jgi:hypothetical protein
MGRSTAYLTNQGKDSEQAPTFHVRDTSSRIAKEGLISTIIFPAREQQVGVMRAPGGRQHSLVVPRNVLERRKRVSKIPCLCRQTQGWLVTHAGCQACTSTLERRSPAARATRRCHTQRSVASARPGATPTRRNTRLSRSHIRSVH